MTTPLEVVKELNYDHHRRMTLLHAAKVRRGEADTSRELDDKSYRQLLSVVPKNRSSVLELGSAAGGQWHLLQEWVATGGRICGIDLFQPLVTEAQKRGLHIIVGFVEDMNAYPDASFDLVCSRHVMEHLGDVDRGIREIHRVLVPGGYAAHVTPFFPEDNEPAHLNKWDLEQWLVTWEDRGFTVVSGERHPFHGGEIHIVARK